MFQSAAVGQTITLNVLRDGAVISLDVTLAKRPQKQSNVSEKVLSGAAWIGISGLTLTPEVAEANSLTKDQRGVLIVSVFDASPAKTGGLLGSTGSENVSGEIIPIGGDVITQLDNQPVIDIESLQEELSKYQPGEIIQIGIIRGGKETKMKLILGERP